MLFARAWEGQSGWEATQAIRAREALARDARAGLLIIGLPAAASTPRDAARCRECGMTTSMAGSGAGGGAAVAQCIRDGMLLRAREASDAQSPASSPAFARPSPEPDGTLAHPSAEPGGAKLDDAGRGPAQQASGSAAAAAVAGGPGPASADPPPPRVLIVSADPGRRAVLAALLRSCAAAAGLAAPPQAQAAPDGAAARGALARGPVDLVFADAEELLLDSDWLPPPAAPARSAASEAGQAARGAAAGRPFVVVMTPAGAGDGAGGGRVGGVDGGPGWRAGAVVERPVTRDAVRSILAEYVALRRAAAQGLPGCVDEARPPLPATAAAPRVQAQAGVAAAAPPLTAGPGDTPSSYTAKILIVEGGLPNVQASHSPTPSSTTFQVEQLLHALCSCQKCTQVCPHKFGQTHAPAHTSSPTRTHTHRMRGDRPNLGCT
jgi:CheY-like chemotaxis protein